MNKKEIFKVALTRFSEGLSAEHDNRAMYKEDTKFENGEQWNEADLQNRAGRPSITINKTAGAVKQILGFARQNRPRIKVRPVDSAGDPGVAGLFTCLIRNLENVSDAEAAYDCGFEASIRGGWGFWRIITDYESEKSFDQTVRIERITNPLTVVMDPFAQRADESDAMWGFITETMSEDKFKKEYPKAKITSWDHDDGNMSDWFQSDSVKVAEYYYKQKYQAELFELEDGRVIEVENPEKTVLTVEAEVGEQTAMFVTGEGLMVPARYIRSRKMDRYKVMWCKLTGGEILEGPTQWPGNFIPIVRSMGEELWVEGKKIYRSAIRHVHDAQRVYNWSRSNTVETLAMAPKQPYMLTPPEIDGHEDQWNEAHLKPKAYRLYNDAGLGRPQPSAPSIPNTGAYREAMVSSDDIKATTGIFDASLGAQGNETSGRAILERKRQGNTATFVFSDNHARAVKYTARILVDLIPKIYDTERVVRLLNEDGTEAWARINYTDPLTGVTFNDLSVGHYDVVYDAGPSYATRRMESAEGMIHLAQTAPQFAAVLIPKIAANMDWPGAQEIAQEMTQMMQSQSQPDPRVERKTELDLEGKELSNAQRAQNLSKASSEADNKTYAIAQRAALDLLQRLNSPGR